jgi:hypothetical protein
MPGYIDGKAPLTVTTLEASVSVQTPYLQHDDAAFSLAVPDPAAVDELAILSGAQTLSSKTLLNPVITSGSLTQPVVIGGRLSGSVVATSEVTESEVYSNYLYHNVSFDPVIVDVDSGATKTLALLSGDVFRVSLTQNCTLTISATSTTVSKSYAVIVKQGEANAFHQMSWMTGFINGMVASGATQRTGAIDYWQVLYDWDTGKHYAIGVKDVQG